MLDWLGAYIGAASQLIFGFHRFLLRFQAIRGERGRKAYFRRVVSGQVSFRRGGELDLGVCHDELLADWDAIDIGKRILERRKEQLNSGRRYDSQAGQD